jgi:hypothetical protein
MRIRINEPRLLPDLMAYLRDCDCVVEPVSPTEIAVEIPAAPTHLAARMEVRVYLTAWRIRNEGATTEIID